MLIGYSRPSNIDPNCEQQNALLYKMDCGKIIEESHSSSKNRHALEQLLNDLKPEDKLAVAKLSSLADSLPHLLELLTTIEEKGAFFLSIEEEIETEIDNHSSFRNHLRHILKFERDTISSKTREGLKEAKLRGISAGRPKIPDENIKLALTMYQSKEYSLSEIKTKTGISKSTLYRYLGNQKINSLE
ncbi:recombinase family protein [Rossellomorea vietnamensis]|uniref:Recombinase family protein n=1 Tax=Rossellomorea vietnamensis TaxID=218284 RepID=A0A5D4NRR1_9BACI|nr:recombinase family protein [Rossellomorea vietnamensis]TYS16580.1 recombinase family protein [Rossellomorea vietnamensis]